MKFKPFLLMSALIGSLALGCGPDKGKIPLNYGQVNDGELVEIRYEDLSSLVDDRRNFLVVTRPEAPCTCWTNFRDVILEPFIMKEHLIVYSLSAGEFRDGEKKRDYYGIDVRSDRETISGFRDGKVAVTEAYKDTNYIFKKPESFAGWFHDHFTSPTMFYLSVEKLDLLYADEGKTFTVVYGYDSCYDCAYVYRTLLKEYSNAHRDAAPLFILDMDKVPGLRVYSGAAGHDLTPESEARYDAFKSDRGLKDDGNDPKYGYGRGYVPTLFSIKAKGAGVYVGEDVILSAAVVFNDVIEKDGDVYKVKTSYYSEARKNSLSYLAKVPKDERTVLEGMTLKADAVTAYGESCFWDHEDAAKYYRPLLNAFLDESLAKSSDGLLGLFAPAGD